MDGKAFLFCFAFFWLLLLLLLELGVKRLLYPTTTSTSTDTSVIETGLTDPLNAFFFCPSFFVDATNMKTIVPYVYFTFQTKCTDTTDTPRWRF